jgi:hypothetical protein
MSGLFIALRPERWKVTLPAVGGFTMLYIDIGKKQAPPKALAILHPILAAIGLILLIIYAMG